MVKFLIERKLPTSLLTSHRAVRDSGGSWGELHCLKLEEGRQKNELYLSAVIF